MFRRSPISLCSLPLLASAAPHQPPPNTVRAAHSRYCSPSLHCLRVLHELGAATSLSAAATDGRTPAHLAVLQGHEGCLRVLHELGAAASLSAADTIGATPAHLAAVQGHEGCLRVLHELGAAATLSAADAIGRTPAHLVAGKGHEGCLRVLHELLSAEIKPGFCKPQIGKCSKR